MGKMIYRELIMVKDTYWNYVMDISKTIYLNIESIESAISFLDNEYSNIEHSYDIINNEIYIKTNEPLNCLNCE